MLVVDNGSRDGSVEAVRERFPAVRVLALPENRGFAGGNNAGIRAALDAGAQGVLLLNNDTRVSPDFLLPAAVGARCLPAAPPRSAAPSTAWTVRRCSTSPMREVRFAQRDAVQLLRRQRAARRTASTSAARSRSRSAAAC